MSAGKKIIGRPSGRLATKKVLVQNIPQPHEPQVRGGQKKKRK